MRFTHLTRPLANLFRPAPAATAPPSLKTEPGSQNAAAQSAEAVQLEAQDAARAAVIRDLESGELKDPREIARLVITGASSRIRQLAAQRVTHPAELKALLKQTRGKDNGVHKLIKLKCDALRIEEQNANALAAEVDEFCTVLERHARRPYDSFYVASLEGFENRRRTLEPQSGPEARARVREAMDSCREVITGHVRDLARQGVEEAQRAALVAAEREAAARAEMEAGQCAEAAALRAAEVDKARDAQARARTERLAAEATLLQQIGSLTGKALGALRAGNTGRAAGLRRALEDKMSTALTMPAHLVAQLRQLDLALQELREWKDYAVAPKRAELIEAMTALIGSTDAPQALADRIKQLQEDWRTISKGVVSDSEADWQRFHSAAQTAYQPCRDYFAAQAKLREENLRKRCEVLTRLAAFEAAQSVDNPDFRTMASVLREAPQEWRRHMPVEPAAGRAAQGEFDAALARLRSRLNAWHAANEADKQTLIQRAQHLLAGDDGREAAEAVKRLQLRWKDIGPAGREREQRLWEEFRGHCDAIFQKRQKSQDELSAALETNTTRAVELCESAEQTAALHGHELLDGLAKIPEWRTAFEAIGELPRGTDRGLRQRFDKAIKLCQDQAAAERGRAKSQSFMNLLEAARRIQSYTWAVSQEIAAAELEALKLSAETFIAGVAQWPKGGAQALDEAWTNTTKPQGATHGATAENEVAGRETALRILCIRGEILTERPTPPEDQALRREYQVQRLMQTMGHGNTAGTDELDGLAFEWLRVGAMPPATYAALLERFTRIRVGL